MFEEFTWDQKSDQIYTQKYGSQFINIDATDSIDKNEGTVFTLNSGIHQYVVKPSENIQAIYWSNSSVIKVKSGRFLIDFSRAKESSAVINADNIKIGGLNDLNANFEIQGSLEFLINGNVSVGSNGTLDVNSLQGHFRFGNTTQSVKLEDNARLSVSSKFSPDTNGMIHGPFELNNESHAELKVTSLTHYDNSIYSLKDSAELWIHADAIQSIQKILMFNLHAGKPQISICGFTEEYCDISSLGKGDADIPKACFNFIKTDGKNEGRVILSCSINSGEIQTTSGALMFWLGANKMLWINGTPSNNTDFNFNYDNDFLVISLKD